MQTLAKKDFCEKSEGLVPFVRKNGRYGIHPDKPIAYKPTSGRIIISIPDKVEKTKSGLHIAGQDYMAGAEYNYQEEVMKVASLVMNSEEGKYMKKWKQFEKLRKTVNREVARVPKTANEQQIGADRYNQIHAEVLAVSDDVTEVEVGDRVYFSYLTIPNLRDANMIFSDDFAERWSVINASQCYFRIKHGENAKEIWMLNDYVLLDPIPIVETSGLSISTQMAKFDSQKAVVAYSENPELKRGDTVIMEAHCDCPLEYSLNMTLPKPYFCVNISEVLAKIE